MRKSITGATFENEKCEDFPWIILPCSERQNHGGKIIQPKPQRRVRLVAQKFAFPDTRARNRSGAGHLYLGPGLMISLILKIGRNIQMAIPPTVTPRNTINNGSMKEFNPERVVSISSSRKSEMR